MTPSEQAAQIIGSADSLIVCAGAGIGVDSGLPDFRGTQGFWQAYPALGASEIQFHQIANPAAFEQHPRRAWGFYGHRLNLYRAKQPHQGFSILKLWGDAMRHGYSVFTSNVDGHFQRAGFDAREINEHHGSIQHLQCLTPCTRDVWPADDFHPVVDEEKCELVSDLPTCAKCGGLARPNILMFYDDGWSEQRSITQAHHQEVWLRKVSAPVVVEIGAGTTIPSVRNFSHHMICDFHARLIRINPTESKVSRDCDVGMRSGALAGLKKIETVRKSPPVAVPVPNANRSLRNP